MTSHDEMRRALDAATPGPWRVYDNAVVDSQYNTVARGPLTGSSPAPGALDDARLIANAPTWLAQLLDELAAKDAEIERLTSIANINATTIDAAQAECASLRARVAELEAALPSDSLCQRIDSLIPYDTQVTLWFERVERARLDAARKDGE